MEFRIIIPPTGEEYKSSDLSSVRARFIHEYKRLEREHKLWRDSGLVADVYIYTPDYVLDYCQYTG